MANEPCIDHCLEALRMSISCNPDLTAYSIFWESDNGIDVGAHTNVPHRCVNWDLLREWMGSKAFSLEELLEMR